MEDASFAGFADLARRLGQRARALGLAVPGFRTPPCVGGSVRTLRRRGDGTAVVAVQVRGRAPEPGEHNREILATHLGLSGEAVESLVRDGVLHESPPVRRKRAKATTEGKSP